jgi:hypothetical protein
MDYFINIKDNEIISCSNLELLDTDVVNAKVTDVTFNEYKTTPDKFYAENNELKRLTDTEYAQKQNQAEKERVSKLSMTKYDFYKYVCQPYGITYDKLMELVNSADEIKVAWELCGAVYRGDETLTTAINKFLPNLTDDKLDKIFKQYGE